MTVDSKGSKVLVPRLKRIDSEVSHHHRHHKDLREGPEGL